jgi:hypothetical protein
MTDGLKAMWKGAVREFSVRHSTTFMIVVDNRIDTALAEIRIRQLPNRNSKPYHLTTFSGYGVLLKADTKVSNERTASITSVEVIVVSWLICVGWLQGNELTHVQLV